MLVLGAILGLFVLFTFVLPLLAGLFKLVLIVGVVALIVFIAVTIVGKSRSSQ